MMKYSLRQLKVLVKAGVALDITLYDSALVEDLVSKRGKLTRIGYSTGAYGLTGLLLKDDQCRLYVITQRSTALFILA